MELEDLKKYVRDIPDFPKEGIVFKDVTPLLHNNEAFHSAIDLMADQLKDIKFDYIASIDARGFILGAALAYKLNKGLILVRKKGKLPYKKITKDYELEYGTNSIEMHADSIKKGDNVIICDDLMATGGTSKAAIDIVNELGGNVTALSFLIELEGLGAREKIGNYPIKSLIKY